MSAAMLAEVPAALRGSDYVMNLLSKVTGAQRNAAAARDQADAATNAAKEAARKARELEREAESKYSAFEAAPLILGGAFAGGAVDNVIGMADSAITPADAIAAVAFIAGKATGREAVQFAALGPLAARARRAGVAASGFAWDGAIAAWGRMGR